MINHLKSCRILTVIHACMFVFIYSQRGRTALMCACISNHAEVLQLLLDRGADLDVVDNVSTV